MANRTGWVPQQHGAWAMLAVPVLAGLVVRVREGASMPALLVPLIVFWFCGYFGFNAVSVWLKAPPSRRPGFARAALTYAGASAVLGVMTLALGGWAMLAWTPAFLPLLMPALVLAAQRRERATIGGALTTAAAALMTLVITHPHPATLQPVTGARAEIVVSIACFVYFFGTVLYVKTNIRERGSQAFYAASVGWHALATLAFAAAAVAGLTTWAWAVMFAIATGRAAWVPRRRPALTPKQIGLAEIAFCVAICLIAAAA